MFKNNAKLTTQEVDVFARLAEEEEEKKEELFDFFESVKQYEIMPQDGPQAPVQFLSRDPVVNVRKLFHSNIQDLWQKKGEFEYGLPDQDVGDVEYRNTQLF